MNMVSIAVKVVLGIVERGSPRDHLVRYGHLLELPPKLIQCTAVPVRNPVTLVRRGRRMERYYKFRNVIQLWLSVKK